MNAPARPDAAWAFARYEAVRDRLPGAAFPCAMQRIGSLEDMADTVDAFLLDAFGVLNVGDTAIPGAADRLARLRGRGKRLVVLTNGATQARAAALAKYHRMGFDFTPDEVVASRDVAAAALSPALRWAGASGPTPDFSDLPVPMADLLADPSQFDRAEGFVLFSSSGWTESHQAALEAALRTRPRPLLIANPDIVAPREGGFSLEPGYYAHRIADATGVVPEFHGKPYGAAYDAVLARLPGIPAHRVAAVGDTLHTDVLGGAAAGMRTVLVTDHGLFAGVDADHFVACSGIVPDFVSGSI